jgi:hypothetical protein
LPYNAQAFKQNPVQLTNYIPEYLAFYFSKSKAVIINFSALKFSRKIWALFWKKERAYDGEI